MTEFTQLWNRQSLLQSVPFKIISHVNHYIRQTKLTTLAKILIHNSCEKILKINSHFGLTADEFKHRKAFYNIAESDTAQNWINSHQKYTWGSLIVSTSKAWKDATASFLRTFTRTLSISCSSLSFRFRNSRCLSFSFSWTKVEESWKKFTLLHKWAWTSNIVHAHS